MSDKNIINWTFTLPKNCNPIDVFLVTLTDQLTKIKENEQLHIILDAREVSKISMSNKMRMDAYWKRYKKLLNERLYFTTLFVNTEEQKAKLDKIYKSGSSTTQYRIVLTSELGNYFDNEGVLESSSNEVN